MGFDPSGNFTRTRGNDSWKGDATAGTRIMANLHDDNDNDLANGLSDSLNRRGKGAALANISMGGFKLTNMADGVDPTDAATVNQIQDVRQFNTGIVIGGSDANGRITFGPGTGETGLTWTDLFFGVDTAAQKFIWADKGDPGLASANNVMELGKDATLTQTVKVDGATAGPFHELYRDRVSTTGGVNGDQIGTLRFAGKDSSNAKTTFSQIVGTIDKADNNAEEGGIAFQRMVAGVMTTGMTVNKDGVAMPQKLSVTGDATVNGNALLPSIHHNAAKTWFTATGGDGHLYHQFTTGYMWQFQTSGAASGSLNYISNNVLTVRFDYQGAAHFYKGATFDDTATFSAIYDATNKYLQFETGYLFIYTKSNGNLAYVCNGGNSTAFTINYAGSITFHATDTFSNGAYFNNTNTHYVGSSGGHEIHQFQTGYYWILNTSTGDLNWIANTNTNATLALSGNYAIRGSTATKAVAGSWVAPSDARLKHIREPYTRGLAEIMALPSARRFTFRRDPEVEHISMIAQDVEAVFPECITQTEGEIEGQQVIDLRQFDPTNLLYAALNAIKELGGKLEAAEARIAQLEAA